MGEIVHIYNSVIFYAQMHLQLSQRAPSVIITSTGEDKQVKDVKTSTVYTMTLFSQYL